jgi:hypothetical protein
MASRSFQMASLAFAAACVLAAGAARADGEKTGPFQGPKANQGFATHTVKDGKSVLTLSPDFVVPDTPDPHWQVVDANGATHLLQRLPIKGDEVNREITLPDTVGAVAKVQIWCAYAEVLLGEASFATPVAK